MSRRMRSPGCAQGLVGTWKIHVSPKLVGELSVRSDQFRRLWERHDIKPAPTPVRTFNHALVGSVELKAESLVITGADGQQLIVYHAEPGSPSERALAQLVDMAAG
jgi:hypothetical protein